MNTRTITGLAAVSLMVAGCAASSQPVASQDISTFSKTERYQAAVNASARQNNVDVHWVNLPDEGDLAHYEESDLGEEGSNGSN